MENSRLLDASIGPRIDDRLIHADFLCRALEQPERVAISYRGLAYSYGEIESRSRGLANLLRQRGLQPGDRVAIVAERTPALIWSLLAASRAGIVFMVLDAAYPKARLEDLIAIGAPTLLISVGGRSQNLAAELSADLKLQLVDGLRAPQTGEELADEISPDHMAYMLFTSGSTGKPKGVACSHEPLNRFIKWQASAFHLGPRDRFSMLSGLSHDPILRDVFAPLSLGATLEIPEQAQILAPGGVRAWLSETKCTVVHGTPAMGQLITAGAKAAELPNLRLVFWGGDLLSGKLIGDVSRIAPAAEHVNFYGATETPQAASFYRVPGDQHAQLRMPIGAGVPGFEVRVLDEQGRDAPFGEDGEVAICSRYLSLGYVENGRVIEPWLDDGAENGMRLYKTGDIGHRQLDGAVLLLGRRDDQVKIRGYRVDLSEIAAALSAIPGVTSAVVLPLRDGDDLKLAAFVAGQDSLEEYALSEALKTALPIYMCPHILKILPEIPLLPNGKVDRKQLEASAQTPSKPNRRAASKTEAVLMASWAPIFGGRALSPDDSFVSLGGDSLSYVHAYLGAQEPLGNLPTNWASLTIAELASLKPKKKPVGISVEAPILIRALAILWVVAVHADLVGENNAGTSALFLVSGFLFARLPLTQAFAPGAKRPLARYLFGLIAPTFLFGAIAFAAKSAHGHHPSLGLLAMAEDFMPTTLTAAQETGHLEFLWYLDALIQISALTCLVVYIARRLGQSSAKTTLLILFAVGCVTRFLLPALIYGGQLQTAAQGTIAELPSTHLATFCLGALFVLFGERSRISWLLGAPYVLLCAVIYGPIVAFAIMATLLMFAVRNVPMFKILALPIYVVADASLFIYLMNLKIVSEVQVLSLKLGGVLRGVAAGDLHVIQFIAAVIGGVGAAFIWKTLLLKLQTMPSLLPPTVGVRILEFRSRMAGFFPSARKVLRVAIATPAPKAP
jgi:amino acid adenylation domain-containing protein